MAEGCRRVGVPAFVERPCPRTGDACCSLGVAGLESRPSLSVRVGPHPVEGLAGVAGLESRPSLSAPGEGGNDGGNDEVSPGWSPGLR